MAGRERLVAPKDTSHPARAVDRDEEARRRRLAARPEASGPRAALASLQGAIGNARVARLLAGDALQRREGEEEEWQKGAAAAAVQAPAQEAAGPAQAESQGAAEATQGPAQESGGANAMEAVGAESQGAAQAGPAEEVQAPRGREEQGTAPIPPVPYEEEEAQRG